MERLTWPAEQGKPGRKPKYNRERIQALVFEKMNYHDEFDPVDPEWRFQADLERAVLAQLGEEGEAPAESTVRELIKEPLKKWRILRAARGR